jgi:phage-related minor tail protein
MDELDRLDDEAAALEATLDNASAAAAETRTQLTQMQAALGDTSRALGNLESGFSGGLRRAFDGLVFDGLKLKDALSIVGQAMIDTTFAAATRPVTDHLGGLLANGVNSLAANLLPFADGAPFSQGRVMPFAQGGVISGPTTFPMRGGTGLMGEAGPEAIMPLARGADGRLGVRTQGGGGTHVTMNISTPDVRGFERSQGQIAARMARALGHGNRNR